MSGQPRDSSITTIPSGAGSMPARSTGGGSMDGNALLQLITAAQTDERVRNALDVLVSGAQGASNAVAGNVTGGVDGMAWLLRQAGVDVGSAPLGGEAWARRVGLIRDPANPLAGAVGEGLGYAASSLLLGPKPKK